MCKAMYNKKKNPKKRWKPGTRCRLSLLVHFSFKEEPKWAATRKETPLMVCVFCLFFFLMWSCTSKFNNMTGVYGGGCMDRGKRRPKWNHILWICCGPTKTQKKHDDKQKKYFCVYVCGLFVRVSRWAPLNKVMIFKGYYFEFVIRRPRISYWKNKWKNKKCIYWCSIRKQEKNNAIKHVAKQWVNFKK